MSSSYVTKDEFDAAIAALNQKIADLSKPSSKVKVLKPSAPAKPQFTRYVDDIIRKYVDKPISVQSVLKELKVQVDAGTIQLYSGFKKIAVVENGKTRDGEVRYSGAAVEKYIQENSIVVKGLNTPDKLPDVKFIRASHGWYKANPYNKVMNAVLDPIVITPPPHRDSPRNKPLPGLTQEDTDYLVRHVGHGERNDAGWVYVAQESLLKTAKNRLSGIPISARRFHSEVKETIKRMDPSPTIQSYDCMQRYLGYLDTKGYIRLQAQGDDLLVQPLKFPELNS